MGTYTEKIRTAPPTTNEVFEVRYGKDRTLHHPDLVDELVQTALKNLGIESPVKINGWTQVDAPTAARAIEMGYYIRQLWADSGELENESQTLYNGMPCFVPDEFIEKISDGGTWYVTLGQLPNHIYVESNEFKHDAMLRVLGDFATREEHLAYAGEIARRLNLTKPETASANPEQTKEA